MKKIIYLDMDGVLVNLTSNIEKFFMDYPHLKLRYEKNPDHIHGIFRDPQPIEGSIDAVFKLNEKYDLFIATLPHGVILILLVIKDIGWRGILVNYFIKKCLLHIEKIY